MNPVVRMRHVSFQYDESTRPVFSDLSLDLNGGVTFLTGPNGSGKTTLLLLAGGRLLPDAGSISLFGRETTEFRDEESRNLLASFIYQNMEFETTGSLDALMEQIYEAGGHIDKRDDFIPELIRVFDLEEDRDKKTQELSKGALQRCIIAFSLLYGSPAVLMDEPVFSLEEERKLRVMEYLTDYAERRGTAFFISAHELPLARRFSHQVLLFSKDGTVEQGSPEAVLTEEKLEASYEIPAAMLREKEALHRRHLLEAAEQLRNG
jgi:iron complex transport system ATP-binding protein